MYTRRSTPHIRLESDHKDQPRPELEARPKADSSAGLVSETGRGRWGRIPSEHGSEEQPLAWEQVPSLRERIRGAVSVPAAIGAAVFGIVVIVTAGIMIRGFTADADLHISEAQQVPLAAGSTSQGVASEREALLPESPLTPVEEPIFIHIVGEVKKSGVLELPQGARVVDAIEAAGGATPLAKLDAINLARVLSDGEHVLIPDAEAADTAGELTFMGLPEAPLADPGSAGKINLNTASAEQLQQLHRVGPALALRIVDWREMNGKFSSVDELLEVSGIGPKTLDQFRDRVTV